MDQFNQTGRYPPQVTHASMPMTPAQGQGPMSVPHSISGSSHPSASPELPFPYSHPQLHMEMDFPQTHDLVGQIHHSYSHSLEFDSRAHSHFHIHSQYHSHPNMVDGEAEQDSYISDDIEYEGETEERPIHEGFPVLNRSTHTLQSTSSESVGDGLAELSETKDLGARKKPRITLPRGRACVACRNRKLKCTGDVPCSTCLKAGLVCKYEELPRRRSRAVILEERVAELEAALGLRPGEPIGRYHPGQPHSHPPSHLPSPAKLGEPVLRSPNEGYLHEARSHSSSSESANSALPTVGGQPPKLSFHSHVELPPHPHHHQATSNSGKTEIIPNSALELALIQVVLPYAPHLGLPLHPQRFLALLTLPPNSPHRPHPALLYILFAQAVRILEVEIPPPRLPPQPASLFGQTFTAPIPSPSLDRNYILAQVGGTSLSLLERARGLLDAGIRNVDRPFDLVRAAVGIAWYLYSVGRFIEGWNIPVSRLLISCGLHRITGNYMPPDGGNGANPELIPKPHAPAHQYSHSHSLITNTASGQTTLPVLRMRPIIIPPARDEIELAERVMTFWAAKMQDWEAGIGWGWSVSLVDDLCTTEWGWGRGQVEVKPPNLAGQRFGLRDLYDATSPMHSVPTADSTYVLAAKSLALLHRSSALFDLAESSYPVALPDGRIGPTHIPSLSAVQSVEIALRSFRQRIPACFADNATGLLHAGAGVSDNRTGFPDQHNPNGYDEFSDPWWIMFQANLYAAEMLMWKEMAHHRPQAYETAVSCARALVALVTRISAEQWALVDMIVVIDISLAARFLFKEADRLGLAGQPQAAHLASEEAELLRSCLSGPFSRYTPMASLHSLVVQRVREGWPEKEGEYERI